VITLFLIVSKDGVSWSAPKKLYDQPIPYSGLEPGLERLVYSVIVDRGGRIVAAVSPTGRQIVIRQSTDEGKTFTTEKTIAMPTESVVPNLFELSDGGLLLVVSRGGESVDSAPASSALTLAYSTSRPDARSWTEFRSLVTRGDDLEGIQLQPDHASFGGREFIVFQAKRAQQSSYQIFLKVSSDGGSSWGRVNEITTFSETSAGLPIAPDQARNERPRLTPLEGRLALIWERTLPGKPGPQIYICHLDGSGTLVDKPEPLTSGNTSLFGRIVPLKGRELAVYSESAASAFRIGIAEKVKGVWDSQTLGRMPGSSQFPNPVVFRDLLFVFWENTQESPTGGVSALVVLRPVTSVNPPMMHAIGFTPGAVVNVDSATIRWDEPADPAGIDFYEFTLKYNGAVVGKPRRIDAADEPNPTVSVPTQQDGLWTFEVVAWDQAGNRSSTAALGFSRKATPPKPVVFLDITDAKDAFLPKDENGFLGGNTFAITWRPGDDSALKGYTYSLQEEQASRAALRAPPARPLTQETRRAYANLENGTYLFTVQSIDEAGNFSEPSTLTLKLDKFKPFTAIYPPVHIAQDELGNVTLTIMGRGFKTDGEIQEVTLSRVEQPALSYAFAPRQDFSVASDTEIDGLRLTDVNESGSYRIIIKHSSRGLYTTATALVEFRSPGTVKIGDFGLLLPRWVGSRAPRTAISFDSLLVVLLVALLAVFSVLAVRRLASIAREGVILRGEVAALLEGRPSAGWEERKRKMKEVQRRGAGLRLKFTLLMIVLVALIVLIVSVPLGWQQIRSQRRTLAEGLRSRSELLLGTLVSSAESSIKVGAQGYPTIAEVPSIIASMKEANFATITGPSDARGGQKQDKDARDYVWASNEKRWQKLKDAGTFRIARERVDDELSAATVPALQKEVNDTLLRDLDPYIIEYETAAGKASVASKQSRIAPEELNRLLEDSGNKLARIDAEAKKHPVYKAGITPPFDSEGAGGGGRLVGFIPAPTRQRLEPLYLFYKPVVFYDYLDKSFYHGLVRLQVSTDAINAQIRATTLSVVSTTGLIALAAIALGVLGAIILANITVTPIKRLARGVAVIRDTDDKEELKDHVISVRTRDEIGLLADTVNDMTRGLVKAAAANKELLLGKDVQKMFLPLERDAENRKGSTAGEETDALEIYGYYEGAKGVSGDYFDFKKLDDTHYAMIKCDVAGKGVPAALIMVEVATLFISYFRDWQKRKESAERERDPKERKQAVLALERVDSLVYTINDMLEERGFKGRFAALTICIFNAATGMATVCNAGDNILHIYESRGRRMAQRKLPESPAAGVFPSMLVEMKSGFAQVPQKLEPGDALFFFTDGFEEAKRTFRNDRYEVIACDAPELREGEQHLGTHAKGTTSEEFGTARIEGVVDAVFSRGRYTLMRSHSPDPAEELAFDFSSCRGTVQDAVLALVAVEKVYRLVPDPRAGEESRVVVDGKVNAFLQKYFLQYPRYFSHAMDGQGQTGSVTFSHIQEDEQYDDLTILVLRRK
jgi:serine phosphatase RsbU (regulator of sigma subunit)